MQRREFLQAGLVAGSATLLNGCGESAQGSDATLGTAAGESGRGDWNVPEFEHAEASITDLQQAQASGRLTARKLAEDYFARMDAIDSAGPRLGAVIERNPDALAIAGELDRERGEKGPRGPLHGIPVLIKDNIDTADRMRTSAGSLALAESVATRDAFLVERLRVAGAVILGKTNLSEWANFRSTRSSSGWSGRGRQTLNPYALDRSPCGSSSGSGAAAAASLCAVAIGTETDGSITCPAKANGLVGLKPTVGLVSRAGIIPISASQDTAGPMTRTVADAAALLGAIAGVDPRDPATAHGAGKASSDYTQFLDPQALKGARLGVVRQMFGQNAHVERVTSEALAQLARLGAVLVDPVEIKGSDELDKAEWTVLMYEFKAGINDYLASLGSDAPHQNLEQLIAFNEANREREMPWFGQEIFIACQEKGPLDSAEYLEAVETCRRLSTVEGIDLVMDEHKLDALVAPTGDPAFPIDLVNGDHYTGGGTSTFPAVSGYPHITVPAGQVFGLPVGLSFIGRAWSEPRLIALAYAFEQATRHRQPPRFLRTAEIPV
jgi:amidase